MRDLKLFLVIASTPLILYFWPSALGGDTDFVSVSGNSMLPTIENGSFAIIKKDLAYDVGEIVAYQYSEAGVSKVIVHRIVERVVDGFVLRGDNNQSSDPETVKEDQIIGKVVFYIPYLGYLPILMKNPLVLAMSIMAFVISAMPDKKSKRARGGRKISLFMPAVLVNLANYVATQVSISIGITPKDGYTTFLLGVFEPYVASTVAFASWYVAIIGFYLLSKRPIKLEDEKPSNLAGGTVQMKYRSISMQSIAELFWMIFIGVHLIYVVVLLRSL